MQVRGLGLAIATLIVIGCAGAAPATSRPASPTATLGTPTQSPTEAPSATPTVYYSVSKAGEGGHGGAPLIDLPSAVAIDYAVRGTCAFTLGLTAEATAAGLPTLTLTVTGPEVTGTWRLSIKPGKYAVVAGEAVGCVYSLTVRGAP